jgi:hypothetical protein
MSKTLYEEAIADANQLRELAEETAKNRVVEAVMPQIRDMINRRILGEQAEDMIDELSADVEGLDDEDGELLGAPVALEQPTDNGGSSGPVINVSAQGDVSIEVDSPEGDEEEVLTDTMAEALGRMIRGEIDVEHSLTEKLDGLESRVEKLRVINEVAVTSSITTSQKARLNLSFAHCLREVMKLREKIILSDQGAHLERRLEAIIKEMKQMSRSNQRNIFDFLFETEDKKEMEELEEAELSLELEDEEVDELVGAEDAPAVDTALEDILGDVEFSLAGESEDAAAEGGEELDMEMEEEPAEDAGDEDMEMEETYELDEATLRREIRRMRRLREQEEGRAAEADPYLAHDGEEVGDVILDVDEDDLINALADELGDSEHTPPAPGASAAAVVAETRRRRAARRRAARRTRTSRTHVNESKTVKQYRNALSGMKRQLVEMNLFNAKLLYANKLMQNKNLTTKQQRAIVEALDNAKTLREAKLLYKSLSESLSRRARGKKLNEGSLRTLGSSSRSTRSASPAKSGVEADRWAVLAGLPGND